MLHRMEDAGGTPDDPEPGAPALRGHVRPRGALRARRRLGLGQSQVNRNGVSRELRGKLKVL